MEAGNEAETGIQCKSALHEFIPISDIISLSVRLTHIDEHLHVRFVDNFEVPIQFGTWNFQQIIMGIFYMDFMINHVPSDPISSISGHRPAVNVISTIDIIHHIPQVSASNCALFCMVQKVVNRPILGVLYQFARNKASCIVCESVQTLLPFYNNS